MNQKYVISVVVIIVVVLLAIVLISKNNENTALAPVASGTPIVSSTPSPSAPADSNLAQDTSSKITVRYGTSGFSPLVVTVKKGQTVEFVNESGAGMSVASDPHPSHSIYPEFDQYKTSYKGQTSFIFTFDKLGSWKYHNHANSSHTGTIIVTE